MKRQVISFSFWYCVYCTHTFTCVGKYQHLYCSIKCEKTNTNKKLFKRAIKKSFEQREKKPENCALVGKDKLDCQ